MSIEGLDFPRAFVNGSIQTDQVKFPFKICRHIFWHHYSAKLTFSLLMALLEIDIFCQQSNILFENKCFLSGPFSFSLTTHACRQSGTDTKANDAITEIFLRFSNIPGIEVSNKNTYWDMVLQMPYFSNFMVSTTFP